MKYFSGLLLTAVAAMALAAPAGAVVVVDRSVDVVGILPGAVALNDSSQNFLIQFSLATATTLNGADVYSQLVTSGAAVTIKFRADVGGAPDLTNLAVLSSSISAVDSQGASSSPTILRGHADFAPLSLAAGTYWFGMSSAGPDIGWNFNFDVPGVTNMWQLNGDTLQFSFNDVSFPTQAAFRLYGGGVVPEPASWALMIIGFGAVGGALRRRRSFATA